MTRSPCSVQLVFKPSDALSVSLVCVKEPESAACERELRRKDAAAEADELLHRRQGGALDKRQHHPHQRLHVLDAGRIECEALIAFLEDFNEN
mgnify:CR=1 FL=1